MKQHLKCADEITKENLDNSANSAIIKSASTPASLQAVVRFQNGSNMSLQHKVSLTQLFEMQRILYRTMAISYYSILRIRHNLLFFFGKFFFFNAIETFLTNDYTSSIEFGFLFGLGAIFYETLFFI